VAALDFTSSLYLGFDHAAWDLPSWPRLTLGKPAALEDPPGAAAAEQELAELTGCQAAVLAPSTLHLFTDLLPMLAGPGSSIFVDRGAYPVAWWGVQQACARGAISTAFGPHDAGELEKVLRPAAGLNPVVVTDGVSVASGRLAPLADYARLAARYRGVLVVDDTQAVGLLGGPPFDSVAYGVGGGGSLEHAGVRWSGAILVNSLAKALGVPLAMLGGAAALVSAFRSRSRTRVHCSPPSVAVIAAARRAISTNRKCGDGLRAALAEKVARFNRGLDRLGLKSNRSLFPVRPVQLPAGVDAAALYAEMERAGVHAVLHPESARARFTFVVTARFHPDDIDEAVERIEGALARASRRSMPAGNVFEGGRIYNAKLQL